MTSHMNTAASLDLIRLAVAHNRLGDDLVARFTDACVARGLDGCATLHRDTTSATYARPDGEVSLEMRRGYVEVAINIDLLGSSAEINDLGDWDEYWAYLDRLAAITGRTADDYRSTEPVCTPDCEPAPEPEIPENQICPDCLGDMNDEFHFGCSFCGGCECQGEC
jgi:hypothetical protein